MYLLLFCFVSAAVPLYTFAAGNDSSSRCVLPEYPEHGTYKVLNLDDGKPGQSFESVSLNYTCQQPYRIVGRSAIFCVSGVWSEPLPKCNRLCKLEHNPSVEYRCLGVEGQENLVRVCDEYEPSGTVVAPICRVNYYSPDVLPNMKCLDGSWDYVASCRAECGTIAPDSLALDGSKSDKLPWYAVIYTKTTQPYMQICGGTLVTPSAVISAAHCFWNMDKIQPKENYAVALGKAYRPWTSPGDEGAHKSDVKDIHIPAQFTGRSTEYESDISVVVMAEPVVYKVFIRPACLSFDTLFEKQQLKVGSLGKVGTWNYNIETQKQSRELKVVDIPYVDPPSCIAKAPTSFRPYITADKMCVGYNNGTGPCRGDGGAGWVLPNFERAMERYYLRGVISTAQTSDDGRACTEQALVTATLLSRHEQFIKRYLDDKNI